MPSFQAVVEDTAPFLLYSANWRAGTSESDGSADQYSQSSFTLTQSANATMSFTFFGDAVGIYGAKRGNHGSYQVQVDNQQVSTGSGVATPDAFNQTLFSTNLQKGFHTVTLTNGGNTYFDVDYVSWQTSVGNDNETLIVNTYQDSHPAFTYSPASSWGPPDFVASFSGSTGHATTSPGSFAEFKFAGDAVGLYGPVGPNGAAVFSVQVDGGTPMNSTTTKQFYRPQQLLYYGGNLGSGVHTLKIQFGSSSGTAQALAIDYAEVYTAPSLGGSFGTTQPILSSSTFPTGALVGVSITSTLAFLALTGLIFMFLRRRPNHPVKTDPKTPNIEDLGVEPFSFSPTSQDISVDNQNHRQPNHNPPSLSLSSSSNPTIATGYPSTYPLSATAVYDDYVSSTPGSVTKDRLRMGLPSAPLESRMLASDASHIVPQPSGLIPMSTGTSVLLAGETVAPPEYHT